MSTEPRVTFGEALDQTSDGRSARVQCLICQVIADLSPDDRNDLLAALETPSIGDTRIARALNKIGYTRINCSNVNRHRKRSQDESSGCAQQS